MTLISRPSICAPHDAHSAFRCPDTSRPDRVEGVATRDATSTTRDCNTNNWRTYIAARRFNHLDHLLAARSYGLTIHLQVSLS